MEDSFGPWSSKPSKNRWDEVKVGHLDKWYDLVAHSFKPTPKDSNDQKKVRKTTETKARPDTGNQTRTANKQSSAPVRQGQSRIPSKTATQQPKKKQPSISSVQVIESPRGTIIERTVAVEEVPPSAFVSVKYEPREYWQDPHTFDAFLSSPQYGLQPWPSKSVSIDEAIGKVKAFYAPKAPDGKGARSAKRSTRK